MTPSTADRANGAVLYASTAVVLAAGAAWWFSAAPAVEVDDQMTAWRSAVEKSAPDRSDQVDARTTVVSPGETGSASGEASPGPYELVLACAGRGQVQSHTFSQATAATGDEGDLVGAHRF